ncbi:IS91 family transposase [Granulosicoccus antarcticus]|uniref:IS91 family transposase n=1 Tax=Granulosicoccus antarcticus TaxID=437505 RepID=UPI003AAB9CB1
MTSSCRAKSNKPPCSTLGRPHTQTRRLDYHPHVHVIIPAGAIDEKRRCWREKRGKFLFVQKALAKVFRAKLLKGLSEQALLPGKKLATEWIVACRPVGSGLSALKYLSRYLYKGVIGEKQLISDNGQRVTFSCRKGGAGKRCTPTVQGPSFIWLILQHGLP